MSFKQARWMAAALLAVALAGFGLGGYVLQSSFLRMAAFALGGCGTAAWLLVTLLWCRCPHCGRRMVQGVLLAAHCPACGKDLLTGELVHIKLK